jgi:mannosyltransferase
MTSRLHRFFDNRQAIVGSLLGMFSAIPRLVNLGSQSLWFDETYTVYIARMPFDRMIRSILVDGVHPPLYYWLMAVWIRLFGASEFSIRLPSALAGALAVVLLYFLVRRVAGEWPGVLAAGLLALSPFAVWYAQDARMYSLMCLGAVPSLYLFLLFLKSDSPVVFLLFVISHAFLYGIHYFGILILFSEMSFVFLFRRIYPGRWRKFLALQGIAILPLVVWTYFLLRRPNGSFGIGWIPHPAPVDPLLSLMNFFFASGGMWTIASVIGIVVVAYFMIRAFAVAGSQEAVALGFLWLAIPLAIIFSISWDIPVYIDRYLVFLLPAAVTLVAMGIAPKRRWWHKGLAGILAVCILPGLIGVISAGAGFQKENWRSAFGYLDQNYRPGDLILYRYFQEIVPAEYYGSSSAEWKALETNQETIIPEVGSVTGTIWLVYWVPSVSAHSFGTPLPEGTADQNGEISGWIKQELTPVTDPQLFAGVWIRGYRPVPAQ